MNKTQVQESMKMYLNVEKLTDCTDAAKLTDYLEHLRKIWEQNNQAEPEPENQKVNLTEKVHQKHPDLNRDKKTEPEHSIPELQTQIKELISKKYPVSHQTKTVKIWLEAMSVQGCSDREKLEKFIKHLKAMTDIKGGKK